MQLVDRAVIAVQRRFRRRERAQELAAVGVPVSAPDRLPVRKKAVVAVAAATLLTAGLGYGEARAGAATDEQLEEARESAEIERDASYDALRAAEARALGAYTAEREARGEPVPNPTTELRDYQDFWAALRTAEGNLSWDDIRADAESEATRDYLDAAEAAEEAYAEAEREYGDAVEAEWEE